MSDPTQAQQQYTPPDPRVAVLSRASAKYQRAGQVAADAVYAMFNRLATKNILMEQAAALTMNAVPAIMEAVLADEDILDPQGEE